MIKRNIAANFLGQGWVAGCGLLFIPLYVHYLGLEAYGLIGIVAVLRVWLSQFDVGMTPTLNREMARFHAGAHTSESIHDLLRSLEILCLVIAFGIFGLVWSCSNYLAGHWIQAQSLSSGEVSSSIRIAAALIALQFCEGIYRGSLIGLQRQLALNSLNIALTTLRHIGAWAVVALMSPTVQAFFAWQCLISILHLLGLMTIVHSALPKPPRRARFSKDVLRSVWKFSAGMLSITTLSILLMQADKIILSRLLRLEDFGLYTLAVTATGVLSLLVSPVLQGFYPKVVQLVTQKDTTSLVRSYHLVAQLTTVLTAPACVLLALYPEGVFLAWTNNLDTALSAGPLVAILAVGTFANAMMRPPYEYMLAHGWTSLSVRINIVAVILVIPALLLLVPYYGAMGAAYVWLALNLSYIVVTIQLMHRKILKEEKTTWYLKDILLPILCAVAIGWLWSYTSPPLTAPRTHWIFFLLLVGITAFVAALAGASELRTRAIRSVKI